MDTSALHQLHDTGYKDIFSVTNCVDLHLFAPNILVHQNRLVRIDLYGSVQIMAKLLFFRDDLHGPSAQNKAGTHQYRIADFAGCCNAVFYVGDGFALGTRDVQFVQQIFKGVSILCFFNGGAVGADDLHTQIC